MEEEKSFKFTEYQKAELEGAFNKFNPDDQGKISIGNVQSFVEKLENSGEQRTPKNPGRNIGLSYSSCFPNSSPECDFESFVSTIENAISDPVVFNRALKQTFKLLDLNNRGFISPEDLVQLGSLLGERIPNEEEGARILSRVQELTDEDRMNLESLRAFFHNDFDQESYP